MLIRDHEVTGMILLNGFSIFVVGLLLEKIIAENSFNEGLLSNNDVN